MNNYFEIISNAYRDYAYYLWNSILHPGWDNFFYWVVGISVFFYLLEISIPWRKDQPKIRKDFWMDLFYIFFNFFLFPLLFWRAGEQVLRSLYSDFIALLHIPDPLLFDVRALPLWASFLLLFIVSDFLSWWVHRLLHRVPFLWEWHKVHHSVEEMGFAAHVRYHWMENVIYWTVRFVPLSIIGYDLVDIFTVHIFNVAWGHFNHANITVPSWITSAIVGLIIGSLIAYEYSSGLPEAALYIGGSLGFALMLSPFMKKLFNSPEMHIWHHAYDIPNKYGVNFGITLAIWDFLFGTAYWPRDGKTIRLGFPRMEEFPKKFFGQIFYGFSKDRNES